MPEMDIARIEERLAAATPGPWVQGWEDGHSWVAFVSNEGERSFDDWRTISAPASDGSRAEADARFIARAPADIAALLAEVKQLREEVQSAEQRGFDIARERFTARDDTGTCTECGVEANAYHLDTCVVVACYVDRGRHLALADSDKGEGK